MTPRLLDVFSGSGGAGMGYRFAGFLVTGVDIEPRENYAAGEFVCEGALGYLERLLYRKSKGEPIPFEGIHASPPCQAYTQLISIAKSQGHDVWHPELIDATRSLLEQTGLPYVIENVVGAPLREPITLCGSSFGLPLRRHRLFETNWPLMGVACAHGALEPKFHVPLGDPRRNKKPSRFVGVYGSTRYRGEDAIRREAMGIDWMNRKQLTQAIPPAYTQFIGEQLMRHLEVLEVPA